jgi:chemotaxis methyl-accepting protein methylase
LRGFFESNSLVTATGFFRLTELYTGLTSTIFTTLHNDMKKDKVLQILSAGCSDGREAYSVAMSLKKLVEKSQISRPFAVTAVDINKNMIQIGRKGQYRLRRDELSKIDEYQEFFDIKEERLASVKPDITRMVTFKSADIMQPGILKYFDLIICANLLLYYKKEIRVKILNTLLQSLNKHGYIFIEGLGSRYMKNVGLERILPGSHFFKRLMTE